LVIALGARWLAGDVYADPAGQPCCLIKRPGWAPRFLMAETHTRANT
jgi:hypothetical protein